MKSLGNMKYMEAKHHKSSFPIGNDDAKLYLSHN